ncbi:hypothetical protein TA3x_000481 [Tundrisphaera sp. TA3]|uniref:hypothetical protein n=1 Tax=Tundrisphaera sp. TA3 TaxID=3435775 RepID=UPI003EB80851
MAIGDKNDFLSRIKALLPRGWFGDETPILDAVLSGIGKALADVYGLIGYARLQTRIASATDGFLDLVSLDFFGDTLPRRNGESDGAFRQRIKAQLLLEKGTRRGLVRALEILTGRTPLVFEPARPADTGGYNAGVMGYNLAGAYGSLALPAQIFVTAYRPMGAGVPNVAGYGDPQGAYNTGSQVQYASRDMIAGAVTDEDIYKAIDGVMPAGTTAWSRILS